MLVMMNVDEIRIPTIYTHTPPRKEKIDNSMLYYMEHGALKSNIVVTQKGLLIDVYCSVVYHRYSVKSIQSLLVGVLMERIGK